MALRKSSGQLQHVPAEDVHDDMLLQVRQRQSVGFVPAALPTAMRAGLVANGSMELWGLDQGGWQIHSAGYRCGVTGVEASTQLAR